MVEAANTDSLVSVEAEVPRSKCCQDWTMSGGDGVTSQMQGSWQAREVGVGLSVCDSALSVCHLSLNRSGMQLGHQDFRKLPNNPNSQPRSRVLSLESPQGHSPDGTLL